MKIETVMCLVSCALIIALGCFSPAALIIGGLVATVLGVTVMIVAPLAYIVVDIFRGAFRLLSKIK